MKVIDCFLSAFGVIPNELGKSLRPFTLQLPFHDTQSTVCIMKMVASRANGVSSKLVFMPKSIEPTMVIHGHYL